jgi:hypothetical protein
VTSSASWTIAPGGKIGPEFPDRRVEAQASHMAGAVGRSYREGLLMPGDQIGQAAVRDFDSLGCPLEPEV